MTKTAFNIEQNTMWDFKANEDRGKLQLHSLVTDLSYVLIIYQSLSGARNKNPGLKSSGSSNGTV